MVIFGKNTQNQVNDLTSGAVAPNVKPVAQKEFDFNQVETKIHQLAKKIQMGKEKNAHLIKVQKEQLEQMRKDLESLEVSLGGASSYMNSVGAKDQETFKEYARKVNELNDQILDKKRVISRTELDVMLLEQEKDEQSINSMLLEWDSYEKEMFSKHISPLHREVTAIKQSYYENLKQLRSKYASLEKLAEQINSDLGDADKITIHSWFEATLNNPELLISKSDEQKEEDITQSYLVE